MATVYVNGTVYTMRHEGDKCTAFVVDDGKFMYSFPASILSPRFAGRKLKLSEGIKPMCTC